MKFFFLFNFLPIVFATNPSSTDSKLALQEVISVDAFNVCVSFKYKERKYKINLSNLQNKINEQASASKKLNGLLENSKYCFNFLKNLFLGELMDYRSKNFSLLTKNFSTPYDAGKNTDTKEKKSLLTDNQYIPKTSKKFGESTKKQSKKQVKSTPVVMSQAKKIKKENETGNCPQELNPSGPKNLSALGVMLKESLNSLESNPSVNSDTSSFRQKNIDNAASSSSNIIMEKGGQMNKGMITRSKKNVSFGWTEYADLYSMLLFSERGSKGKGVTNRTCKHSNPKKKAVKKKKKL